MYYIGWPELRDWEREREREQSPESTQSEKESTKICLELSNTGLLKIIYIVISRA